MTIDKQLLEIMACPEDKGPLFYFKDESLFYNPRLMRVYKIKDGIPVMLIDEAVTVSKEEHTRLLELAKTLGIKPNFES